MDNSQPVWVYDERNPRARSRVIRDEDILTAVQDALSDGQPRWLSGGTVPRSYPGRAMADYAAVLVLDGYACVWATREAATRTQYGRKLPGPEAIARRCLPSLPTDEDSEGMPPPWRRGATQAEINDYCKTLTAHLVVGRQLPGWEKTKAKMETDRDYWVTDGEGDTLRLQGTPQEVAQEYVDSGYWGESDKTQWVDIHVYDAEPWVGDFVIQENHVDTITVAIEPEEPDCEHPHGHIYATPYSLVGGLKENPGVQGSGGGTKGTYVCMLCGLVQHWDNWAQRPDTGEQGLDSTEYDKDTAGSADVIDSDEKTAIVEIQNCCFVVNLEKETYKEGYNGLTITIGSVEYVAQDGRWLETY